MQTALYYSDFGLASGSSMTLANIYLKQKDNKQAIEWILKSREYVSKSNAYFGFKKLYPLLSKYYMIIGKEQKAEEFIDSALFVRDSLFRKFNALQLLRAKQKADVIKHEANLKVANDKQKSKAFQLNLILIVFEGSGSSSAWINTVGIDAGNNLDTSPLFLNAPDFSIAPFISGDYNLQSTSPAINAGLDTYFNIGQLPDLSSITTDLNGNARQNGTIDMGAYEYLGTLPVNLLSFTAKAGTKSARLSWETSSENNNKVYYLRNSTDGIHFEYLATIVPKSINSNSTQNYSYLDKNPFKGINYYQLVQEDLNGNTKDLGIRAVDFQIENHKISIYPNPTLDKVNVTFESGKYQELVLMDLGGKILKLLKIKTTDLNKEINLIEYPAQIYILQLKGNDGIIREKVIKL